MCLVAAYFATERLIMKKNPKVASYTVVEDDLIVGEPFIPFKHGLGIYFGLGYKGWKDGTNIDPKFGEFKVYYTRRNKLVDKTQ